jgi:methanogenic corrinoid protein MtbC1
MDSARIIEMCNELRDAIADLREPESMNLVRQLLESGTRPQDIVDSGIEAMSVIGRRFECGEYFLPELMMAGDIMKGIGALTLPHLAGASMPSSGRRIVLGTVQGDIHDVGKNIVRFLLEANGYVVDDLGVDVPPARFVAAVQETHATVVGISALLTVSYDAMKKTILALEEAGLRKNIRIMVGGAPVDERVLAYVGGDALGKTAVDAVGLADKWFANAT